ncbi:C-C chemokine receptor type 4-like [Amblyraja radiata]|uniref:C-C chemokine receptor type 4-like n=1 Tax=Amblyraja radiata TaxID=386614 RepID=UPI001403EC0E|nr:C-C chemokine receptor type 4-like [Amblyraja radiata]
MSTTEMLTNYSDYDYNYDTNAPCAMGSAKNFGQFLLPVLYSLVFLFGLPGNALVLWIFGRYRRPRTMTDICLLNLAISDLLFVISLPFWAYFVANQWIFGDAFCKIINAFYVLGYYGSMMFITLISVDRYLAIVHAVFSIRRRNIVHGLISSLVMWCLAILASLPSLIFTQVISMEGRYVCHFFSPNNNWRLFTIFRDNALGFLVPLVIIFFCYLNIVITLLKNRSKKKHRAIKVILIVVISFFVCWTPHNIVMLLMSLKNLQVLSGCDINLRLSIAQQITESFTFVHCCLNPIIYAFVGQNFRSDIRRLFHLPSTCGLKAYNKDQFTSREVISSDNKSSSVM